MAPRRVDLEHQRLELERHAYSPLTETIIGAAIEVHRELGPGLLESVYEGCLAHELLSRRVRFERQIAVPVVYKGTPIDIGFRLDFLIEDTVIVELKAIDRLAGVHEAQLTTYLRLSGKRVGLLINFNSKLLKDGIVRRVL